MGGWPSAPPPGTIFSRERRSPTSSRCRPRTLAPHRCPTTSHPEPAAGAPVHELYEHQRAAWDAAARGEHLILATGTASGSRSRSTCPCSTRSRASPKSRALYLYPTKALAQDQARALAELRAPNLRAAIYDGDTPGERRWQIRKWANVILTNPDMLHVGVLPHHDRWADVLHNLRYVVVDEAHVYRGVFGSHVGNVLRRLRRLAQVYGAEPQFLIASATIANPGELAQSCRGSRSDRHRRRRGPARRAHDPALEPGAAGRRARPTRERARRRVEADGATSSRAASARSASRRAEKPRS